MQETTNLGLKKPDASDFYDVGDNNDNMDVIDEKMGNLSELETTEKNSLVSAINEVFTLGNEKKQKLVTNLIAMGVTCTIEDSWETLLAKVLDIFTGTDVSDTTATEDCVIDGYKFHTKDGALATGTIPVNSAWTRATTMWEDVNNHVVGMTIPLGYYNVKTADGCTTIEVSPELVRNALAIDSSKMLQGYSVAGVEGTIPVIPNGWQAPNGWIDAGSLNMGVHFPNGAYLEQDPWVWIPVSRIRDQYGITPDKIVTGQSIAGVNGTGGGTGKYASGSFTVTQITSIGSRWTKLPNASCQNDYETDIYVCQINTYLDWTPTFAKITYTAVPKSGGTSIPVCILLLKDSVTNTCISHGSGSYERSIAGNWTKWINGNVLTIPLHNGNSDYYDLTAATWEAWGN